MEESKRRFEGRNYHKKIFGTLNTTSTLNDLRWAIIKEGNAYIFLRDRRLSFQNIKKPFGLADDYELALYHGHPEEAIIKIKAKLNQNFFDMVHTNCHVIADAPQIPEGELQVIGCYNGLYKTSGEKFFDGYVANVYFSSEKPGKTYDHSALFEKYDATRIRQEVTNFRDQHFDQGYFLMPMNQDTPALKEDIKSDEFAITPTAFLESAARGSFARQKISKVSKYGDEIFTDPLKINLMKVRAHAVYADDTEAELALKIARDEPVPRSRMPFTATEIKKVKELVAYTRAEISKI